MNKVGLKNILSPSNVKIPREASAYIKVHFTWTKKGKWIAVQSNDSGGNSQSAHPHRLVLGRHDVNSLVWTNGRSGVFQSTNLGHAAKGGTDLLFAKTFGDAREGIGAWFGISSQDRRRARTLRTYERIYFSLTCCAKDTVAKPPVIWGSL